MDRQEVKLFLKRYRRLEERKRAVADRIKRIEDSATGTTANLDGMPRASGTGDKVGKGATDAADFKRELDRLGAEADKAEREIFFTIDKVENAYCAEILNRHYIGFQTFPVIADAMHYTERWVQELHGRALDAVGEIIERREE